MNFQNISKKTCIIVLLVIMLLLYVFFYSNKQENIPDNGGDIYTNLVQKYINVYPQRSVISFYIDTEETRNDISNMAINFQQNQIFILYDEPNNRMLVFDFDNAIAIYDFNTNTMITYLPKNNPNADYYKFYIFGFSLNKMMNYKLLIEYSAGIRSADIHSEFELNKMNLFNLINLDNLLHSVHSNNEQLSKNIDSLDPTQELQVLPQYNKFKQNYSSQTDTNQNSGEIFSAEKSNHSGIFSAEKSNQGIIEVSGRRILPDNAVGDIGSASTTTVEKSNPITKCISQEVFQSIKSDIKKLYLPHNPSNAIDGINGFFLNYNNYNIIKTQIDLFKTFTDDQIVCILESDNPNLCDKLNRELSDDDNGGFNELFKFVKTSHQIMSLYQNQLLDIKTIVLPRILNVINKCNTITKNNKLKALNGLRNLLYTVEYISSILGNNWDLIKNIDNSIKNLN